MNIRLFYIICCLLTFTGISSFTSYSQDVQIALLKYNGGGDWYANPTALPNLVQFCNQHLKTRINKEIATVEVGSPDLYNYPFIHMTGHGNVVFSNAESENLRNYLLGGGFLHIDDNYGMDEFIRLELKKVFPNEELVAIPANHEIFNQKYKFPNGMPKIHKHDDKSAQAFGIIKNGRLVLVYTYETDLGDGWEDPEVHNDSEAKHEEALKMGANLIQYAFNLGTINITN